MGRNLESRSKNLYTKKGGNNISKEKIVVVEDEIIVAMEIQSRLENFGYAVPAIASSGEQAIKKVEEHLPDLVLMDIVLKGEMDGIEAAEQIRSRFDIPVVYLTAYADEDTLKRAKVTGPFGYILKPFEERELRSNIEIALCKVRSERKLKESEKWLAATIRSIGDAVIATDMNGNIKLMNPFAEALTGWRQKESAGKPLRTVFNIVSRDSVNPVEDPLVKVVREGVFYGLAGHTVLITKDGTEIPVEIIGSPIKDDRDNLMGVVLVFYDTLERKKIEDELKSFSKGSN